MSRRPADGARADLPSTPGGETVVYRRIGLWNGRDQTWHHDRLHTGQIEIERAPIPGCPHPMATMGVGPADLS
jgi:hypothetical protein